jgi:hypothetical protein
MNSHFDPGGTAKAVYATTAFPRDVLAGSPPTAAARCLNANSFTLA